MSGAVPAGKHGLIVAQDQRAAACGATVLRRGGNAADAVVVTALALGVVEPWMSGLMACGHGLFFDAATGAVTSVDFAGVTPRGLDPQAYPLDPMGGVSFLGYPAVADARNIVGGTAVVVPGAVAGLSAALERFGTLAWDRALAPVIDLARGGVPVDWHTTLAIALAAGDLARDPATAALWLPGGAPPQPGVALPLDATVVTLEALAERGPEAFYRATVAERLVADLRAHGSVIDADDLAAYRISIAPAAAHEWDGRCAYVGPETSGGPRLAAMLPALDGFDDTPARRLALARGIDTAMRAHRWASIGQGSTTHINTVDHAGNAASLTLTLLNRFGARLLLPRTGLMANNGMAWFDPRPGRHNSLASDARAQSNMCPLLVMDGQGLYAALGASGGNQIVPALAQVLAILPRVAADPARALAVPRFDIQGDGRVTVMPALSPTTRQALAAAFQVVEVADTLFPRRFAAPSVLARCEDGRYTGAGDRLYPHAGAVPA